MFSRQIEKFIFLYGSVNVLHKMGMYCWHRVWRVKKTGSRFCEGKYLCMYLYCRHIRHVFKWEMTWISSLARRGSCSTHSALRHNDVDQKLPLDKRHTAFLTALNSADNDWQWHTHRAATLRDCERPQIIWCLLLQEWSSKETLVDLLDAIRIISF